MAEKSFFLQIFLTNSQEKFLIGGHIIFSFTTLYN